VGQRFDAFDVQHPADLQLDRAVPDHQPQPIAFHELGGGSGQENFVGREQLRPPLAQRIDADHPDAALGPRQPGVEFQPGTHRGDPREPGDHRIERLRKSAAPASDLQVRLAGEAAHRRGELVHRGAVDQVHAVAERDTEGDAEDREQRPAARAARAEHPEQTQHAAYYNYGSSGPRQRDILRRPARLSSSRLARLVSNEGAAMKKTGAALAALLCFVSVPLAALADPSFYLGYTGKKWTKDYGIIAGTCDAAAVSKSVAAKPEGA